MMQFPPPPRVGDGMIDGRRLFSFEKKKMLFHVPLLGDPELRTVAALLGTLGDLAPSQ